jgi:hypothetical protein
MPPAKILDLPTELHLEILLRIVIQSFHDVLYDVKAMFWEKKAANWVEYGFHDEEPCLCPHCLAKPCASACHIDGLVQELSQKAEASLEPYLAVCFPARLLWGSCKQLIFHRAAEEHLRDFSELRIKKSRRYMVRTRLQWIMWTIVELELELQPGMRWTGLLFGDLCEDLEDFLRMTDQATALRRF